MSSIAEFLGGSSAPNATFSAPGIVRQTINHVLDNGLKCDERTASDGVTTASSTTFSSASAAFTSADVGKLIVIPGAGAFSSGANDFLTVTARIDAVVDAHTLTLHTAATTAKTGALYWYFTDDTAAFQALINTVSGSGGGIIRFGLSPTRISVVEPKDNVIIEGVHPLLPATIKSIPTPLNSDGSVHYPNGVSPIYIANLGGVAPTPGAALPCNPPPAPTLSTASTGGTVPFGQFGLMAAYVDAAGNIGSAGVEGLIIVPGNPTPAAVGTSSATIGGTIPASQTYPVSVTTVNATGETLGSTNAFVSTGSGTATNTITVNSPLAQPGATGWYAYVGQNSGIAGSGTRQQTAGSPTAIGTALTLTAPPTNTGAALPSSNTSGTNTNTITVQVPTAVYTSSVTNPGTPLQPVTPTYSAQTHAVGINVYITEFRTSSIFAGSGSEYLVGTFTDTTTNPGFYTAVISAPPPFVNKTQRAPTEDSWPGIAWNIKNVVLRNLHIQGSGAYSSSATSGNNNEFGLFAEYTDQLVLENVTVTDVPFNGVHLASCRNFRVHNIWVKTVYGPVQQAGSGAGGTGFEMFSGCRSGVLGNIQIEDVDGHGFTIDTGHGNQAGQTGSFDPMNGSYMLRQARNITVTNLTVKRCGKGAASTNQVGSFVFLKGCRGCTLTNLSLYDNGTSHLNPAIQIAETQVGTTVTDFGATDNVISGFTMEKVCWTPISFESAQRNKVVHGSVRNMGMNPFAQTSSIYGVIFQRQGTWSWQNSGYPGFPYPGGNFAPYDCIDNVVEDVDFLQENGVGRFSFETLFDGTYVNVWRNRLINCRAFNAPFLNAGQSAYQGASGGITSGSQALVGPSGGVLTGVVVNGGGAGAAPDQQVGTAPMTGANANYVGGYDSYAPHSAAIPATASPVGAALGSSPPQPGVVGDLQSLVISFGTGSGTVTGGGIILNLNLPTLNKPARVPIATFTPANAATAGLVFYQDATSSTSVVKIGITPASAAILAAGQSTNPYAVNVTLG